MQTKLISISHFKIKSLCITVKSKTKMIIHVCKPVLVMLNSTFFCVKQLFIKIIIYFKYKNSIYLIIVIIHISKLMYFNVPGHDGTIRSERRIVFVRLIKDIPLGFQRKLPEKFEHLY